MAAEGRVTAANHAGGEPLHSITEGEPDPSTSSSSSSPTTSARADQNGSTMGPFAPSSDDIAADATVTSTYDAERATTVVSDSMSASVDDAERAATPTTTTPTTTPAEHPPPQEPQRRESEDGASNNLAAIAPTTSNNNKTTTRRTSFQLFRRASNDSVESDKPPLAPGTRRASATSFGGSGGSLGVTMRRFSDPFTQRYKAKRRGTNEESVCGSESSRRSSLSVPFGNVWSRMAKNDNAWTNEDESDESDHRHRAPLIDSNDCRRSCTSGWKSAKHTFGIGMRTPTIALFAFLTFAILCTAGLLTVYKFADSYESDQKDEARSKAEEMGYRVSRQLDESLLPLFTMSQFVQHLDSFGNLPFQIGPRGEEGSAPPLVGKDVTHRDVSGICDDAELLETFNGIASNVKRDANMGGILVNVQLAPFGVVCLVNPIVNTEDFPPGIALDNTGAIGHDLLNDPNRIFIARATIPAHPDPVIAGPLTLIQGDDPLVKEALIARLAIYMEGYNIPLDGVDYPCWGFAVIILNWAELKKKAGVDEIFRDAGLEWNLTRTDVLVDADTGEKTERVKSIGSSPNADILNEENSVFVELDTTNNRWTMTVGYEDGFSAPWFGSLCAFVVVLSFVISLMLMAILVAKKDMQALLYNMMPKRIISKLQHGDTVCERYACATIFFSDIVGFTTLSGQMTALDVMDMLNDLYSEFDSIVAKHGVCKVETIGDAYIVIGGGPDNCMTAEGAQKVALFALDALKVVKSYKTKEGYKVAIRCGIASGPVVGGIVGKTMPKFTLFGDTVNLASRMESSSTKMKIQCMDVTYRLLRDAPEYDFALEERKTGDQSGVHVKGKGHMNTWWINEASLREGEEKRSNGEKTATDERNDDSDDLEAPTS